jgi:peptidoglycan/xylan/chitin deacetylase (PgdA/CDA1 family)
MPLYTPRFLVLTFDDGVKCHADAVAPLLQKYGFEGEFFINPASVGRKDYVSWDDLQKMSLAGASIQSHGYDHVFMDDLDERKLHHQLTESRRCILEKLGIAPIAFAPPGGRISPKVFEASRSAGFRICCSGLPGLTTTDRLNQIVPRLTIHPRHRWTRLCHSASDI